MPETRYGRLEREITEAIADEQKQDSLYRCMKRGRDTRAATLAVLPGGAAFRQEVKAVKERCIACQQELLDRFVANARKRGVTVFLAKDGAAAIEYAINLAREKGAKTISKSKSLTTEEIEINEPMEQAGFRVVETDLGELIIQLVHEKPYHLVFPSVHKTKEHVAKIFEAETGEPVSNDIPAIMRVVRKYLRPIFLNTDIGMTGANVGIAETGGIVIETNEGNARLVSSIGHTHICVMGIEKIVDTVEDALLMVLAHPVSASGQLPTTYVTWMHGRSPLGVGEGTPRDSHIIILDNGRTAMRDDPKMREALHCIRCGACMNICPTYAVVGGHTFGHIYPGPIGIPWTAQCHGLETAGDFAPLCISCGLCKEICPADIDMPMMIAEVRQRDAATHPQPAVNRVMMAADSLAALGSATAPVSNWFLRNRAFRVVLEKLAGVDRRRELPPFSRKTFAKQFAARQYGRIADPSHKVAFFVDVFANYNAPELGVAAVDALEACGCAIAVPQQRSSGYPFIAYGDLRKATDVARYNVDRFLPYVEDGFVIVSPEPTAVYSLTKAYPKLLGDDASRRVAAAASELFEFLLHAETAPPEQILQGRRFGFHCACHQRPLSSGAAAMEWLRRSGAEVILVETGTCCGMGGTFGLKAGPLGYDLAQAVGKNLFDAFRDAKVDTIVTESSVCTMQLREGTGLPVIHPLRLLT